MANKAETAKQIEALKKLGLSENEIAEVLADDKKIDQGEKLFELPDELKQGAKKARQADRKTIATATKREKKVDDDKQFLINLFAETLNPHSDSGIEIVNNEREFTFSYNGTKYRITLAKPRT